MGFKYLSEVITLKYDAEKCTGCGRCEEVCPHNVFEMQSGRADMKRRGQCMECGACQKNCQYGAISVDSGVGCAAAIISSFMSGKKEICCDDTNCC